MLNTTNFIGLTYEEQYFLNHENEWTIIAKDLQTSEWCLTLEAYLNPIIKGAMQIAIENDHLIYIHIPHHLPNTGLSTSLINNKISYKQWLSYVEDYLVAVSKLWRNIGYKRTLTFIIHPIELLISESMDFDSDYEINQSMLKHMVSFCREQQANLLFELVPHQQLTLYQYIFMLKQLPLVKPCCMDLAHLMDYLIKNKEEDATSYRQIQELVELTSYAHIHSQSNPHGELQPWKEIEVHILDELKKYGVPLNLELLKYACNDYASAIKMGLVQLKTRD